MTEFIEPELTELKTNLRALGFELSAWPEPSRKALTAIYQYSQAGRRYLEARPKIALLFQEERFIRTAKPLATMNAELRQRRAAATDDEHFKKLMIRYRLREWVRITGRDLANLGSIEDILQETSALAEALLECITAYHRLRLPQEKTKISALKNALLRNQSGFSILAEGKLGGAELNLSSDIDLQYLYHLIGEHPPEIAAAVYEDYALLAHKITKTLASKTPLGFAYRVDLDLRPEGTKGRLINSLSSLERYYETFGRAWERLALIRARHVGGKRWITAKFLQLIRPFVFPRTLAGESIKEIQELQQRSSKQSLLQKNLIRDEQDIDIKKDPGYIREIELFVQIFQFLHGGRLTELREANLLKALGMLSKYALIPQKEAQFLKDSYRFLRKLENTLQAREERQTQLLPREPTILIELQQIVEPYMLPLLADQPTDLELKEHALKAFLPQLAKKVLALSLALLPRETASKNQELATYPFLLALTSEGALQVHLLEKIGFTNGLEAQDLLRVWQKSGPVTCNPMATNLDNQDHSLVLAMLKDILESPDPLQALRLLVELNTQLLPYKGYYELLAQTPLLRKRLIDLLGTSEFLGKAIINYPELIDYLSNLKEEPNTNLQQELAKRLHRLQQRYLKATTPDEFLELALRSLRRFKLQEELRIGLLDLAGSLTLVELLQELTNLAEICLQAVYELASQQSTSLAATIGPQGFVIMALGRLGAQEMTYGSDLDLIFIYQESLIPKEQVKQIIKLAQNIMQFLTIHLAEGVLYPIDIRLRPSGNQGPLVCSDNAFKRYYQTEAYLFEKQALLRARAVAGDLQLGKDVLAALADIRYPEKLDLIKTKQEINRLKKRLRAEYAPKSVAEKKSNLKIDEGSIMDIEFIVQYFIMCHARAYPELQIGNTLAALKILEEKQLLEPKVAKQLSKAYIFLRTLENRLRIVHNKAETKFSLDEPTFNKLAKSLGENFTGLTLQKEYLYIKETTTHIYDSLLGNA